MMLAGTKYVPMPLRVMLLVMRVTGGAWKRRPGKVFGDAVKNQDQQVARLGSRIAARFAKIGLTKELPELRDQPPRSTDFGK
jgi:hypothetical protein